eukprot:4483732-Lingulodinium_polyedra.AAC.1
MTLVLGPPSRLYLVLATVAHLRQRGFPDAHWVHTLETTSLDVNDTRANARLMACWATTVLPLLIRLADKFE